jgi:hypothetical protein
MPEAPPPPLLFHLVHPSTVHYCVIVFYYFTPVGAYLCVVTYFGIAVSKEAILYRCIDSSRTYYSTQCNTTKMLAYRLSTAPNSET